jgi:hypothetical protein
MPFALPEAKPPDACTASILHQPANWLADMPAASWAAFARTWDDLPVDGHMADGGTYRRRRHAAFRLVAGQLERLPHRPHFQERDHNPLNGGIERWFAPILPVTVAAAPFAAILARTAALIGNGNWLIEAHQFRVSAGPREPGLPTPEGMHRDGRDRVLIVLTGSANVRGGLTEIEDEAGRPLARYRLATPGEALLLDDARVRHGTSPIERIDPARPAWRDTLVLTFARMGARTG